MRRGEKNRMIGKNGGVKRSKMPKETNGCLHARPNSSDTTRSAIIVLHREQRALKTNFSSPLNPPFFSP
jgi:hypothetical protein